jgi:hypothetical protein
LEPSPSLKHFSSVSTICNRLELDVHPHKKNNHLRKLQPSMSTQWHG